MIPPNNKKFFCFFKQAWFLLVPAIVLSAVGSQAAQSRLETRDYRQAEARPVATLQQLKLKVEAKDSSVTTSDYCEFLNGSAALDSYGLYDEKMGNQTTGCRLQATGSEITTASLIRSGKPGNYHYEVMDGKENSPINYVSQNTAMCYCDWLENAASTSTLNFDCCEVAMSCEADSQLRSNRLSLHRVTASDTAPALNQKNMIEEGSSIVKIVAVIATTIAAVSGEDGVRGQEIEEPRRSTVTAPHVPDDSNIRQENASTVTTHENISLPNQQENQQHLLETIEREKLSLLTTPLPIIDTSLNEANNTSSDVSTLTSMTDHSVSYTGYFVPLPPQSHPYYYDAATVEWNELSHQWETQQQFYATLPQVEEHVLWWTYYEDMLKEAQGAYQDYDYARRNTHQAFLYGADEAYLKIMRAREEESRVYFDGIMQHAGAAKQSAQFLFDQYQALQNQVYVPTAELSLPQQQLQSEIAEQNIYRHYDAIDALHQNTSALQIASPLPLPQETERAIENQPSKRKRLWTKKNWKAQQKEQKQQSSGIRTYADVLRENLLRQPLQQASNSSQTIAKRLEAPRSRTPLAILKRPTSTVPSSLEKEASSTSRPITTIQGNSMEEWQPVRPFNRKTSINTLLSQNNNLQTIEEGVESGSDSSAFVDSLESSLSIPKRIVAEQKKPFSKKPAQEIVTTSSTLALPPLSTELKTEEEIPFTSQELEHLQRLGWDQAILKSRSLDAYFLRLTKPIIDATRVVYDTWNEARAAEDYVRACQEAQERKTHLGEGQLATEKYIEAEAAVLRTRKALHDYDTFLMSKGELEEAALQEISRNPVLLSPSLPLSERILRYWIPNYQELGKTMQEGFAAGAHATFKAKNANEYAAEVLRVTQARAKAKAEEARVVQEKQKLLEDEARRERLQKELIEEEERDKASQGTSLGKKKKGKNNQQPPTTLVLASKQKTVTTNKLEIVVPKSAVIEAPPKVEESSLRYWCNRFMETYQMARQARLEAENPDDYMNRLFVITHRDDPETLRKLANGKSK